MTKLRAPDGGGLRHRGLANGRAIPLFLSAGRLPSLELLALNTSSVLLLLARQSLAVLWLPFLPGF